jgi:hypothetical protein
MGTQIVNGMSTLRWATVRCGKPRWVRNVVRKWTKDKQNANVLGRANNKVSALGPAHEQKYVCMIFEETFIRSDTNLLV